MTEVSTTKTFATRLKDFRRDVAQCDWSDDKILTMAGSKGYPYLSTDKAKRNLAPLLVKHGLELTMDFSDMQILPAVGNMTQHFVVRLCATVYDPDNPDHCITSTVYGEAGDSGDKGMIKAQTAAVKQWIVQNYLIADGIDMMVAASGGEYYTKSPEEQEEVKSKVLEKAIAPKQKPEPKPEPVKEEPKEVPKEVPKETPKEEPAPAVEETDQMPAPEEKPKGRRKKEPAPEIPPEDEDAPEPKEAEAPQSMNSPHAEYEFKKPHKLAINNILSAWERNAKEGKVSVEEYNAMSMEYASIASDSDAITFIKNYRV